MFVKLITEEKDRPKDALVDPTTEDAIKDLLEIVANDGRVKWYNPSVEKLAARIGCTFLLQHPTGGFAEDKNN